MRIAQIAPLFESVPPLGYGGTERVVSYLTEELVRQGHDVTLFASGDSVTSARLHAPRLRSLRLDPAGTTPLLSHVLMMEHVAQLAGNFDLLHFHTDHLHFPLVRRLATPHVTTLHGRLDLPDLVPLYREFNDMPVVSISEAQREPLPCANWQATVHHGLPPGLLRPGDGDGGYLAFLGRISAEKRVDRAVEIARRVGLPLRVAAKVDAQDADYYATVEHLLKQQGVEFMGEIGEAEKGEFLGRALALLFPIEWPEPFGMVMIEAMACGTPVIAFRRGSVPEVIEDGVSGVIVEDIEQAVSAIRVAARLDRAAVRQRFDERFSAERMARDYVRLYERLVEAQATPAPLVRPLTEALGG